MLCRDIIRVIEDTYPEHAALEWDNVGLLVGSTEKEINRIYVALDATDEVIDDAIAKGADMLVTHHPLIFSPLKQITDEHFIGSRVVKLLQHDISYYAMHTNYDVLRMAELSSVILGLNDAEVLGRIGAEQSGEIGRIGTLSSEMTLHGCCELIKEKFHLETVKVSGNLNSIVRTVAISPGSGKEALQPAIEKKADVLVTGDIDHHEGVDTLAQGVSIIDAGHYGLEHIFIEDMANYLAERFENIEIEKAEIVHPFQVI